MRMRLLTIIALLTCLPALDAQAQTVRCGTWVMPPMNPWDRRALRERAVAYAGPMSRALVESENGDQAALALLRCSPGGAATLVAFYASGDLSKIPHAGHLLLTIAQPNGGDSVCQYAIQHAHELMDPDCCDAFLAKPFDFILGLKQLPAAAAEIRARRFGMWSDYGFSFDGGYDRRTVAWVAAFIGLIALVVWRRRRNQDRNLPA